MLQGPVVENLSKRCGGFLKALSLRGCQVITDQALGYACPLSLGLWIVKGVVVGEGGGGAKSHDYQSGHQGSSH